jgi:hypothetical protein
MHNPPGGELSAHLLIMPAYALPFIRGCANRNPVWIPVSATRERLNPRVVADYPVNPLDVTLP